MKNKIDELVAKNEKPGDVVKQSKGAFSVKIRKINEICRSLDTDSEPYDVERTLLLLKNYLKEEDRLLYSEISNYIYSLDTQSVGIFNTNLINLVDTYMGSEEREEYIEKAIVKLYDHSLLAIAQTRNLIKDDMEFKRMIEEKTIPIYDDFAKALQRESKEVTSSLTAQLLSLVAIFTALAFLIFGGINSLDNIFQNLTDLPLLKLLSLGCVWGLCINNIIFVFMYFVCKIIGKDIKTNHSVRANFVQRYPFTCFSNLIIIVILMVCGWLYFIDTKNIGGWFMKVTQNPVAGILGIIAIILFFIVSFLYLVNKCKEDNNIC